ncbi:MAG TPA: DNA gyrase subunit A, partial [Chloroflexi bacterium]|nr:DNA gyrase subunit A [Chloroflexota bacterium]
VITEIPYQVNKTTLIENIAKLVRSGKIEGIADLRDESDRQGMRLVIDLTRNANTHQVLEDLYQHTPLESRFSMILLALVDGEPRTLSLKKALTVYLEHRLEVLQRRSRYELERARQRAHIVEGLLIALDDLDTVIDIIRRSRTVETARNNLRKQLKLSEVQAQAILDMPLKRLAALERRKLQDEYKELQQTIKTLEALLKSPKKQRAAIREDLLAVRAAYADARRTRVLEVKGESVEVGALTPDEPAWVVVTREGRLGRQPDEGKPPRIPSRPQQTPLAVLAASTRDTLYLFTQEGLAVALPVHQIAEGEAWEGEGCPWSQVTRLDNGNVITALALPAEPPPGALFFVTAQGQVKRMAAEELPGVGREPAVAVRLDAGDALREVLWVTEEDEVVLGSAHGQGIRFAVAEVRPTGASAGGMAGMRLEQKDEVVGATVVNLRMMLLTMTDRGAGKRSGFDEIPSQRRGGKGVQIAKLERGEQLAGIGCLRTTDPFVMTTVRGNAKTISGRVAPSQGRATHGDSLIALQGSDLVARLLVPQLRPEE